MPYKTLLRLVQAVTTAVCPPISYLSRGGGGAGAKAPTRHKHHGELHVTTAKINQLPHVPTLGHVEFLVHMVLARPPLLQILVESHFESLLIIYVIPGTAVPGTRYIILLSPKGVHHSD